MIKKYRLSLFFMLYLGYTMASNFVHPVTPAFLQSIDAPSSMFGFAFAAMAIGQFVSSAPWGKIGDKIGYARTVAIGYFIYGASAIVFSLATSWHFVILGRFIGGIGIAGLSVSSMAYITAFDAPTEDKNKLLVIYASMQSIGGAFGFLIGGVIGDFNIYYSFYSQAITLAVLGLAMLMFIKEAPAFVPTAEKLKAKDFNPFTSLIASSKLINITIGVFLLSVFISQFAATGFDQNFNYYLRVKLDFAPSSSGMFKAVVGMIALIANMTINMWIVKHTNISKSMSVMLVMCGVSLTAVVFANGQTMTLLCAFSYYAFSSIFLPLQQSVMLKNDQGATKGAVAGLFNAARAFGMMTGPTFAGLVFDINPNYAFLTFAGAMVLAAVISYINYKQLKKQGVYK